MISLEMDMVQYDCPYIDTTEDYGVSFHSKQWEFNAATEKLETRMLVTGESPQELDRGLDRLRTHDHMRNVELLRRQGEKALVRSKIGETKAMEAIRANQGFITGPFEIREGSELWRIGFDNEDIANNALADLERHNDFAVNSRESIGLEDYYDVLRHVDVAGRFLDSCRALSEVERETLRTAVREGYFTRPREATLSTLAEEFDVSKTAVSKNLRRSQRKILGEVVETIDAVEEADPIGEPE